MKTLAIRQPYAALIVAGIKNIENRSWATKYRGDLAIYASKAFSKADVRAEREFCEENGWSFPAELPTGCVIGVVELAGIFQKSQPGAGTEFEFLQKSDKSRVMFPLNLAWYDDEGFGWILQRPRKISPVSFTGKLGLFDIPDDLIKFE